MTDLPSNKGKEFELHLEDRPSRRFGAIGNDRIDSPEGSSFHEPPSALHQRYLRLTCSYKARQDPEYTNDLPSAVTSGSVFMYADDTTVYCIGDTVDNTVTSLNKALSELNSWCLENSLTPHSAKCEAMLLMRKLHIGQLNSVTIGEDRIESVGETLSSFRRYYR